MIAARWRSGKLGDRGGDQPLALAGFGMFGRIRRRVGELAGVLQIDPRRAPFAVEAEIDHDPRKPGAERCQRLPARRMGPDPQHGFLDGIFGVGGVAENAAGKPQHRRKMALRKLVKRPFVATRDPGHERFVAVIHRLPAAAIGKTRAF